jgi:hypothetical protein
MFCGASSAAGGEWCVFWREFRWPFIEPGPEKKEEKEEEEEEEPKRQKNTSTSRRVEYRSKPARKIAVDDFDDDDDDDEIELDLDDF